ncbi:MAG: type IV pilus assembly protein PilM [Planctomycetota bacterium]
MDSHSLTWGLDIGATSIKAVRLQRTGERVVVHGYAIEPILAGEDVDRDEAVVKSLQTLAQREEMRGVPVVACLSGRQIFSRTINVPVLNPKKVDRMVELEAKQQIPGDFDEVQWGYHLSPAADGMSNDVALFAARQEVVDDLTDKCRRAGLTLAGISVSSLAVYNFVQYDQAFESDETVIVLDVGAENTDLVIYQGDSLWMRNLGVSGNDITRTFMKKFRVSFEEAENLKTQVGDSRQQDRILKVIEGSLVELIGDVQRSLGFYKNQNPEAEFENVVVSGGTFRLPGLAQYMADRLGMAIITLIELERIEVAPGLEREHFLDDLQSLGVCMGLGLQGLGVGQANVDLMPSHLKLQTILRSKRWAAIALLVVLPLAFSMCHFVEQRRLEENLRMIDKVNQRVEKNRELQQDLYRPEDLPEQVLESIRQVQSYADHAEHVGLYTCIESAVLAAIGDMATDGSMVLPNNRGDPMDRMDPIPLPLYFEGMEIPEFRSSEDVSVFAQLQQPRTLRLEVRISRLGKAEQLVPQLQRQLENLRIDQRMYRVLHPDPLKALPAQMPKMFSSVSVEGSRWRPEEWTYSDPTHFDEGGNLAPITNRIQFRVQTYTYSCTFGGEGAWSGEKEAR